MRDLSPDSHARTVGGRGGATCRLRRPPRRVLKSHGPRMKHIHHCDCSCHAASATGGVKSASTGFFVLSLSVSLLLCGLINAGVIPLRFW